MITSVERAFFHAGARNAGTPLEIASTPVTAAPPEPNALSTRNNDAPISSPVPDLVPICSMPGRSVRPWGNPVTIQR